MSGLVRLTHAGHDGYAPGPILFDVDQIRRVRTWPGDPARACVQLAGEAYEYVVEESVDQVAALLHALGAAEAAQAA